MLLQSYDSTSTSDWKEKKYPLAIFFETAKTVLFQWILLQMNIQHIYGKVNYWELLVATKFHFSWDFLYYEIPCNAILKTRCSWNMYRITQRPAYIKNDFQSFRNVAGGQNGLKCSYIYKCNTMKHRFLWPVAICQVNVLFRAPKGDIPGILQDRVIWQRTFFCVMTWKVTTR